MTYDPKAPRPELRGPRPESWKSGPDPVEHAKYRAYIQMKNQAQWRGETWDISFEQYKYLWGERWHQRGRERGCWCMTRLDPEQPWTPDNVHVLEREIHARAQSQAARAGYRSPAQQRWRQQRGLPDEKRKPGRRKKDEDV